METLSLHTCTVLQHRAVINRAYMFFHFIAILFLLYYRFTRFFHQNDALSASSWAMLTLSELIFTFVWILTQSFRWRPVIRSALPENLPGDADLPSVDVFVCTADPKKEPTVEVMNTILSAMAIDYQPEKLAVYLSDDGGSPVTLYAMKEAARFAQSWVPFCSKYGIKTRCPEAYFSSVGDDERVLRVNEFSEEEEELKRKYEEIKKKVARVGNEDDNSRVVFDRPPRVEMILDNHNQIAGEARTIPLLVYLSRERRQSSPHNYKAGALNNLLRVSGLISNGPFILVLDCDMYCNDPTSAKQAMCFHLDPHISSSLAFVQFPQLFYNASKKDIYDGQARSAFKSKWQGMDGLRGPVLSGTGFYIKRKALYESPYEKDISSLDDLRKCFGTSSEFLESLNAAEKYPDDVNLEEVTLLASTTYEENTEWGKKIGFSYDCLLESTFTGYRLQCEGWISVYLYPNRPCFLGCTTIDMKEAMVQLMKWSSELFQISLSRFSPLVYGVSRMSILQSMCYAYFGLVHVTSFAIIFYGLVPQWCLFNGIPLYPKLSDPWFVVFSLVYISSLSAHLVEVLSTGDSIQTWWNEQKIWIMKSVTGGLFGIIDACMKMMGMKKVSLNLTNKVVDKEKLEKYEKGKFDFQGAAMFMVPLSLLAIWNLICFIVGVGRVIIDASFMEMFGQMYISCFILVLSYPILEGIITRKSM